MSTVDSDLTAALAAVAQALVVERDLTAVASRTCELAVATIPGCEHADVMIMGKGSSISVPAATDRVATRVLSIEAELDVGPCVDAARKGELVDVPDLSRERRWPEFSRRCLQETPVRSTIGLPLLVGARAIGAVDIYAEEPGAFDGDSKGAAALFAGHVAVAFAAARERQELAEALATRDLIGQAKGILMAQSHVTADEAFAMLHSASQRMNTKLVEVAQRVLDANVSDRPSQSE